MIDVQYVDVCASVPCAPPPALQEGSIPSGDRTSKKLLLKVLTLLVTVVPGPGVLAPTQAVAACQCLPLKKDGTGQERKALPEPLVSAHCSSITHPCGSRKHHWSSGVYDDGQLRCMMLCAPGSSFLARMPVSAPPVSVHTPRPGGGAGEGDWLTEPTKRGGAGGAG